MTLEALRWQDRKMRGLVPQPQRGETIRLPARDLRWSARRAPAYVPREDVPREVGSPEYFAVNPVTLESIDFPFSGQMPITCGSFKNAVRVSDTDFSIAQILNWPRDQDMVLEGRRMYQALDIVQATKDFAQNCTSDQAQGIRECKRLILSSSACWSGSWAPSERHVVIGYGMGRSWIVEF